MNTSSLKTKITRYIKSRSGIGSIITVLGAAVATALIVFPLVRWQMSLTQNVTETTQNLQDMNTEVEARAALEDRWRQISDMSITEFGAAPNKWSKDSATKYGKYLIWEKFSALGTYNSSTGQCNTGTPPTEDDKSCRVATLQATDATGTTVYSSVTSTRVAPSTKIVRNENKTTLWTVSNYTSPTAIDKTVTAPENGMVVMWTCFHCNTLQFNIYVNGYHVVHQNVPTCDTLAPFMVNKGDAIRITTGAGPTTGFLNLQVFLIPTA